MNDDRFTPETVEEQLDALSTSAAHAPGTPVIRLTQDIERYRLEHDEEVHRALQRAWERIEARRLPIQPSQLAQEQTQPLELPRTPQQLRQQYRADRLHIIRQRIALISLVALLLLLIGGAGLFIQHNNQPEKSKTGNSPSNTMTTSCKNSQGQSIQCHPLQPGPQPQATPPPTNMLSNGSPLATDEFTSAPGVLQGSADGTGWSGAWNVQNNANNKPGYTTAHSASLHYSNLRAADTYASGGLNYLTAGRGLDLRNNGPFSSYLTNGQIGRSGTTLWLSVLMRKDSITNQPFAVSLHDSGITWCPRCINPQASIGYFSPGKDGKPYWSLQLGSTIYSSNVLISAEQTTLLVLRLDFGATTTGTLYVNPQTLGGNAPTIASAQGTMNTPLLIRSIAYYGGDFVGASSLAEIRLGGSYGVVTPIQ